ncbi:MAG: Rne/Rng family ribonuclease [Candidatus Schekmanbacteria bacterium]|nr:MAG: Rne/Rng family ribonuclease [Candidatus Schekmanbacteria bacterium]
MSKQFIVNSTNYETRLAVLEEGNVVEIYIERKKERGYVGNIYKGRVTKVLPGMQAAFLDIGTEKAGFLYVDDICDDAEAYREFLETEESVFNNNVEESELVEIETEPQFLKERKKRSNVQIEDLLKDGQELLVQVARDPIGTKGPRLTSYISLPGRYLVLMPTVKHIGVSRKIEDRYERMRLKTIVEDLNKSNYGYIVRTVSEGKDEEEFISDMDFLTKLWKSISEKAEKRHSPGLIHSDLDLILRSIRDMLTMDVERVLIDSKKDYERCLKFVREFLPHYEDRIHHYESNEPIFDAFGIEVEIDKALGKKVWLKSGGYIVIDETEALVSIDVNTGRYVGKKNLQDTILKTNLEAVKEIAYQIRLRNIGGIIIIDFIDMQKEENREKVYKALEYEVSKDRIKTNILKISELGLIQMTRKRVRESLSKILCQPCEYCEGRGMVKSVDTVFFDILRKITRELSRVPHKKIMISVHPSIADKFYEEENHIIEDLEKTYHKKLVIKTDFDCHLEEYDIMTM